MSNGKRTIGVFGAAGVLVAALIIASFMVGGNILQAQSKGVLTIEVMDAPADVESLWLTISQVEIQSEDGGWTELTMLESFEQPFDLLALQVTAETLTEDEIPPGSYSMIRLHVTQASVESKDGNELTAPSGVIKVLFKPKLEIVGDEETTVLIDLQPEDLSSIAISHTLNLRPVIKAVVTQDST